MSRRRRNPYRWDVVDPELFHGRRALADELVAGLTEGRSYGLAGGRRMGKTTLLRRIEADLLAEDARAREAGLAVIPVYLDVHSLPALRDADGVFDALIESVAAALPERADLGPRGPRHPAARALAEHIAGASEFRPQVIVLFDEIKPVVDAEWGGAFLSNWRSFLHNEPTLSPYLSAVFSGHTALDALHHDAGSPLVNVLTWRGLRLFDAEATTALAREPSGLELDGAFRERLHEETGGHPFLIQLVMHHVVEGYRAATQGGDGEAPDSLGNILATALQQAGEEQHRQLARWWERLDDAARALYDEAQRRRGPVGRGGPAELSDPVRWGRAAELLATTGIARLAADGASVSAAGDLFARWHGANVAGADEDDSGSTRRVPPGPSHVPDASTVSLPPETDDTRTRMLDRAVERLGIACLKGEVRRDPDLLAHIEADDGLLRRIRVACARGGRCLGRYILLEEIGRGGMGRVFRGFDARLRRTVAIKLILESRWAEDEDRTRFLREARLTARFRHPGIVTVHDVGEHDPGDGGPAHVYLVMDFIPGESFQKLIEREGRLEPKEAAETIAAIARALHHAHEEGALHRDVKPQNVLLDDDGGVHLCDFGLARDLDGNDDITKSDVVVGTPAYLAPEQVKARKDLQGPPTDIWALGVILYRAVTGRLPFEGESTMTILNAICRDDPVPPVRLEPWIPDDLDAIVMRCLEKEPNRRYRRAATLARDLEQFAKESPPQWPGSTRDESDDDGDRDD